MFPLIGFSQTYWDTNGNIVTIGKNKFGTINDFEVVFITNNLERMRLTNTGYLGIGTTNPQQLFHVNGNIRFSALTSGTQTTALMLDANGDLSTRGLNISNWDNAYSWGNHAGLYRPISWVPAWTDVTSKPSFATVATSGSYNDLLNLPSLFDGNYNSLSNLPTLFDGNWSSLTGSEPQISFFANDAGYITSPNDADADPVNEIQDLDLTGNILTITNNGTATQIDLSQYLDDTDTHLTESEVDDMVSNNGYIAVELDGDPTNELQNLSFSGDQLSISNGNSVSLSGLNFWSKLNNNLFYSSGNVGIGTNNPQKQIHIHNPNNSIIGTGGGAGNPTPDTRGLQINSESALLITNKNSGSAATDGLIIRSTNNNAYIYLQETGNLEFLTKKPLRFKMESNGNIAIGTIQSNFFVVKESGKVGIKTNDPTAAFDINGDIRIRQSAAENYVLTSTENGTGQWKELKLLLNGNTLSLANHNSSVDLGVLKQTLSISNQQLVLSNDGGSVPLNSINYWSKSGNRLYYENTVGIGTTSPDQDSKLHIVGNSKAIFLQPIINSGGNGYSDISFYNPVQQQTSWTIRAHVNDPQKGNALMFWSRTGAPLLVLGTEVKVGIGTPDPQYTLDVRGNAHFCEVRVKTENWCDFVFDDNYQLPDLQQLELFIKTNRHLPDVPSEAEVIENGVDLGEMNKVLLQKVEELTLIIIEQDKRLRKLEEEKANNSGN